MLQDQIFNYVPLWGNWYVKSLIGQGSFGSVYKVYREEIGQKYYAAVKIISVPSKEQLREAHLTIGRDENTLRWYFEDMIKTIVDEVRMLYSLSGNSNIINYQDHQVFKRPNELGWDILIRMEYVTSLRDYLENHLMKREEVIRLGIDLCSALEVCQRQNIIHRDIKDENIFINEYGVFKLGDFGIAKELSKSGRAASMRGTPLYMAPEVYRGEEYDSTVDIYSLGLVLYRLLNSGRLPFMPPYPGIIRFKDSEEALEKRLSGETLAMPVKASDVFGQIIVKACSYSPRDRYSSVSLLKSELETVFRSMTEETRNELVTLNPNNANVDSKSLDISIDKEPSPNSKLSATESVYGTSKKLAQTESAYLERENYEENQAVVENLKANKIRIKSKKGLILVIITVVIIFGVSGVALAKSYFIPRVDYNKSVKMLESGNYTEAASIFLHLGNFKDSTTMYSESLYLQAQTLMRSNQYEDASVLLDKINNYKDAKQLFLSCRQSLADDAFKKGDYETAIKEYSILDQSTSTIEKLKESHYLLAKKHFDAKDFTKAIEEYSQVSDYKDNEDLLKVTKYSYGEQLFGQEKYYESAKLFMEVYPYKNSLDYCNQAAEKLNNTNPNESQEITAFIKTNSTSTIPQQVKTNTPHSISLDDLQGKWFRYVLDKKTGVKAPIQATDVQYTQTVTFSGTSYILEDSMDRSTGTVSINNNNLYFSGTNTQLADGLKWPDKWYEPIVTYSNGILKTDNPYQFGEDIEYIYEKMN